MALSPGTRLGPYEVVAPIGAGGMGEVYRARDPRLLRDVAIKVIASDGAPDPDRLRRFEQEAKAVAAIDHPHILAVHDVGTQDGTAYVVFELLEGDTLRDRLRRGAMAPRKVLELAGPICQGLAAAHARGIVHRDLKPENLFVTKDGRIKILDFGLARLSEGVSAEGQRGVDTQTATQPGLVMGTVGYMSPEQVRGKPADARSDLFAVGAILYEMLTGQRAFQGATAADTLSAVLNHEPPEVSTFSGSAPGGLERVVRRCLDKDPEQRFQSARDVAFALEAVSSSSAVSAATAAQPAGPGVRWLMGTAALALAVGAAFILGQKRAERPAPRWTRITFRRGNIGGARFARDGQSVLYSGRWGNEPSEVFSIRRDAVDSRALGLQGEVAATTAGEMAVVLPNATLARLPLEGGVPREIAEHVSEADWAPDGTLAIVRQESTGPRIEFPPGHVLYASTGLGGIQTLRVSPRGDLVAFVDRPAAITDLAGEVVVMDRGGKRAVLSRGWSAVGGLAWSHDGSEVWFTATKAGLSQALHAVTLGGRERLVAETGTHLRVLDISGDGRVLVEQGRRGSEARGRLASDVAERDYSWLDATMGTLFSPDGRSFLFNESGDGGGSFGSAFLRRTDGSPPLRLGDGSPLDVSPDGKWVVSVPSSFPKQLLLVPVGPGEARALPRGTVSELQWAKFLPDGKRLVVVGSERGRPRRLFVQTLPDGLPRPFAPEGTMVWTACGTTPDGRLFPGLPSSGERGYVLFPIDGGAPQPIPGIAVGDRPLRFSADGASLFVREGDWSRARVARLDLKTGHKTSWLDLAPPDSAGVSIIVVVDLPPDGKGYLYDYWRTLSDLYVVGGLR